MMKTLCIMILCATLVVGCVTAPVDPHQKTIASLDDSIYALSAAIDVVVDTLPPDSRDDQIISVVTAKDPSLTAPFAGYTLKAEIQDGTGVILLCDKDAHVAYIEDVTCTPRIDTLRPTGSPCLFFLDVKKVCTEIQRNK
ncbi:MAG: hypothetical protein M0Z67_02595 [Nitrospiraceae bacterium]|nr:hypothetical protein [Nitrospiraceae bacterium]